MTPGHHAVRAPDATAIVMGSTGERTSYAELEDRSLRFARYVRGRGFDVGDHIAILMENNRTYLEVAWAAQRAASTTPRSTRT